MSEKKYNIQCMSIHHTENGPAGARSWEITSDGKVWPCCKFVTDLYPPEHAHLKENNPGNETINDKKIMDLIKSDPDWNNAFKRPMEDILNHPIYQEYISLKGWETDTPPIPCQKYCNFNQTENRNEKHASRHKVQS
jgi:hypothetical protein